ncbi:MAG: glycosyltransferase family 9 protein [Bacteroidales bacterium]|nr:glycosyltransferase family 9 protein [Bacteroidales bacterium]MDD4214950.1 glycosyltransferase family 9 protein [Bacteroidales bacterium]
MKKGCESLFAGHPHLNNILIWDKSEKKYSRLFPLLTQIRKKRYDYLINLQRFASTGLLAVFSKADFVSGFDKNPFSYLFDKSVNHIIGENSKMHEINRNLMLIEKIVKPLPHVRLYPSQTDFDKVSSYKNQEYICIAPASLWKTKQFPEHKWVEFIHALPSKYMVYLIGAKSDFGLCDNILRQTTSKTVQNIAGRLSLLETAALMRDAVMNYTNDSAPMHLASALNSPVAAIFCSTVPDFGFGPSSENSHIIESDEKLNCRPCGLHGHNFCPENHFNCANNISVNQLLLCLNP